MDDFIYGGSAKFLDTIIPHIRTTFKIGLEEASGMKYLGISICQTAREISLSTDSYCSSLKEIHNLGVNKDRSLDEQEVKSLKHLSGQLNWIVTQSRPDVAYDNCIVGNSISRATVRDVLQANKAVRKAKSHDVSLKYLSTFDIKSWYIIGYTDASFGNLSDGGSQGAYMIFLCDSYGHSALMTWQSRRIRRAVNSTLAAECVAAVETAEACIHLKCLMQEIMNKNNLREIPIRILCDNRSLVDSAHASTAVNNKRLQIEVGILRDMIQKAELEEFRWIPTGLQVANALTKAGCSCEDIYQILGGHVLFCPESGKFI